MLKRALESKWPILMEEIGLWTPADVVNSEHNDKPENEQDPGNIDCFLKSFVILFPFAVIFSFVGHLLVLFCSKFCKI